MHKVSSFELVSCFSNHLWPYGYTKPQADRHSQPYPLTPDFPSIRCVNPPLNPRNKFVSSFRVLFQPYRYTETQGRQHSQPYPTHSRLSIISLCQPASKCMKRVHLNSFRVSVTISGRMDTQSPKPTDILSHIPSHPTFHPFAVSTHL